VITAKKPPKAEEVWAQRIIALHLDREVHQHDDNRMDGMYDLRIGHPHAPEVAIEVTGALNPEWTETWNVGPAKGDFPLPGLTGSWMVSISPDANVRMLRRVLPGILAELDQIGLLRVMDVELLRHGSKDLHRQLQPLGIEHLDRYSDTGPGRYALTMMGTGGAIDSTGDSIAPWIGDFLRAPERSDVLAKLERSGAPLREVFVAVTLDGAPWSVVSYLTDVSQTEFTVPSHDPVLPEPVTGVWITSTLSFGETVGVRWDGAAWSPFRSRGEGIDDE